MSKKKESTIRNQVAKEMQKFEDNILKALNDYERVQELNRFQEIIEAEILHWINLVQKEEKKINDLPKSLRSAHKTGMKNVRDNATFHIAEMKEIIDLINKYRKEFLPKAMEIVKARENEGQEVVDIEYLSKLEDIEI